MKRFIAQRYIFVIICLNLSGIVYGSRSVQQQDSIQADMAHFFQSFGSVANSTAGNVYQDQTAGHYTGGSLYARNTVHNTQLATLQVPGYRAGCGGIDMHFGALSYISSEQLVKVMRSIGSSMASYGLMLAIETMSPQVKNIITELNDLAQKVNMANINSCKVAATALGAVLPQSDAANHHLCTMIGSDKAYGGFSDYAAANQGCGAEGKRQSTLNRGRDLPQFAKMLGTEFNLAWQAIQENEFLRKDSQLAEFFMSLSGTILSLPKDDGYEIISKPSLVNRNSLLTTLLQGGETTLYRCDDKDKCLKLKEHSFKIPQDKALISLMRTMLSTIQNKIYNDEALAASEIAFLNSTKLPFYKIINVATAYRQGASPIMVQDYAEIAAVDVLFHYLEEIITIIEESVAHIRSAQVDESQIKRFTAGLREARTQVHQRRMGGIKELEQVLALIRKTELLEKSISAGLGTIAAEGL